MELVRATEKIVRCRLEIEEGFDKDYRPYVYVSMEIGKNKKPMKWDICGDGYFEEEYNQLCDLTMLLFGEEGKKPEEFEGKEVDVFIYKEHVWAIGKEDFLIIPYWLIANSEGRIPYQRCYSSRSVRRYLSEELPIIVGE